MKIKEIVNKVLNFGINRIIEIIGISIVIVGVLLLVSLISFSPDDPNFIFPDNTIIKNLLGFRGSFTADLFFQSFGLISILIPFSFILTGTNIVLKKKIILVIESLFYTTIYFCLDLYFLQFSIQMHFSFTLMETVVL